MERVLVLVVALCVGGIVNLGGAMSRTLTADVAGIATAPSRVGGSTIAATGTVARTIGKASRAARDLAARSRVVQLLDFLTTAEDGRLSYKPSFLRTATTLGEHMASIGLEPIGTFPNAKGGQRFLQRFEFPADVRQGIPEGQHSYNIVGLIRANRDTKRTIVIGAHADGVGADAGKLYQGADDNASGTTAALLAAELLNRYQNQTQALDVNIVILLTSGEEQGLLGSTAFTQIQNGFGDMDVLHVLNTDMVSQPRGGQLAVFAGNTYAEEDANRLFRYAQELTGEDGTATELRGIDVIRGVDEDGGNDLWNRSDHKAFIEAGIESIFVTTGLHNRYHLGSDRFRLPNGSISPDFDIGSIRRVSQLFSRLIVDGVKKGWFDDSTPVTLPLPQ